MQTSAIILQVLLILLLVYGLLLAVVPGNVNQFQRDVLRALRLISDQAARATLSERGVLVNRLAGVVYVAICLAVLLNLQLQIGKRTDSALPVWTNGAVLTETGSSLLHEKISNIVKPAMGQRVGLVVATIAGDARDITGFGRVNPSSDRPPDGDTLFEIGSVSKVFTGVLLADLVERGKVTLETPMVALLPSVSVKPDSQTNRITLEHLVTHTSGLPRAADNPFNPIQLWRVMTAGDPYRDYTDATVLQLVSRNEPSHPPGERYAYSNVGFGVLGFLLSGQYGQDYDQTVKTVIDKPLALQDTNVHLNQAQQARLASGYRSYLPIGPFYLAQRSSPWEFPNVMAGAGGLRSTANDMMTVLAANMGREPSDLAAALQQSHKVLYAKGDVQIGMAWQYKPLPKSGKVIIWHDGETGGYSSFLGFTDDGRVGVVILSNSAQSVNGIGYAILDALALP